MNKTAYKSNLDSAITVDINGLKQLLSCGERTARIIAEEANAQIPIGNKRVLYSVERIREYINAETSRPIHYTSGPD